MKTNEVLLTIGIPSLPNRQRKYLEPLYAKLLSQIGTEKDIEVISIIDNKIMSIGRKRTALFNIAQGKYTCLIDDDDDIVDDFISTFRNNVSINTDVDVVCYKQEANINGRTWIIDTSIKNNTHPYDQLELDSNGIPKVCNRPPWHWCSWKTEFARKFPFGDSNTQEDSVFVNNIIKQAKTELHIDKVMCKYNWSPSVSEAPFQPIPLEQIDIVKL